MKFSMILSMAIVSAAMAAPDYEYLSACSTNSGTPCRCPAGTVFAESSTYTLIGAAAKDVAALTLDFFNTTWLGATPYATNGPDNTVGSTRSLAGFATTEGAYNITEQLTKRQLLPNGAYIQRFEIHKSTLPIEYFAKNGSLSGYWITYQTNSVFEYETAVISSVYSCATGHPIDFGAFQRYAWGNLIKTLTQQGKAPGQSIQPQSVQQWTAGPN